jgi:2-aminobenzoate-CoA ligase
MTDTFARDHLPAPDAWPDLLLLDGPARVNAALELLDHEGTAIAGGWSYGELRQRAEAVASALAIEPGTRVLLHSPNTPEAIAAWLGILLAGGIVVATMPLLRAREIEKVVAKANVTHALVTRDLCREVGPLDVYIIEDLPERGTFAAVDTAADDVAIIAFTSGTTGTPKGCVHFHRDLLAACDTFAHSVIDPQPGDVFSGTPPLAFTFGLGGLVLFPLRFGAATAPVAKPGPEAMLEAIREQQITTLFTAPTAYRAMLSGDVGASLHTCVSAGEPLPAGVSDAWYEKTGIRIVDEDMRTLPPGAVGKLAVRGPTGCRYLDDPRQASYVRDGWNLTGDAFSMDADGYFWFQARTDDMIISSGYNISGFEVEAALLEHPLVAECAVVAVPDPERGHVVKAFVVAAEPVEARALQDHVKALIAPYKYPRRIEFVAELPRTPTGKVQRNVLRERSQ